MGLSFTSEAVSLFKMENVKAEIGSTSVANLTSILSRCRDLQSLLTLWTIIKSSRTNVPLIITVFHSFIFVFSDHHSVAHHFTILVGPSSITDLRWLIKITNEMLPQWCWNLIGIIVCSRIVCLQYYDKKEITKNTFVYMLQKRQFFQIIGTRHWLFILIHGSPARFVIPGCPIWISGLSYGYYLKQSKTWVSKPLGAVDQWSSSSTFRTFHMKCPTFTRVRPDLTAGRSFS